MNNPEDGQFRVSQEDIDLILAIKKKWTQATFFSGDSLDINGIKEGVTWLYSMQNKPQPELQFFDSPFPCIEKERQIQISSGMKREKWLLHHAITHDFTSSLIRQDFMSAAPLLLEAAETVLSKRLSQLYGVDKM
ncbi:MAG: hypothetical protein HY806_01910, partial [Nitrospirae bacterium]|nr:hypothetical protein [Nitrospirota bacterium]